MPKVSVVLPAFNAQEHLSEALSSLQAQSFEDFEVLCINDGSKDQTPQIIDTFAQRDSRFRAFHRPHLGLVDSLNYGLKMADAPYLARMDADDQCHPDRFFAQVSTLDQKNTIAVSATQVSLNEQTQPGMQRYVTWSNQVLSPEAIALQRFIESPVVHPSVMFRQSCLQHGAYKDGMFPEDYELWLRWLQAGLKFEKLPQELLMWRDGPNRLTRTDSRYNQDGFFEVKARYLSLWLKHSGRSAVWVWGAGRLTRKRALKLTHFGVQIEAWIDIDPKKMDKQLSGRPVFDPEACLKRKPFIVVYVTSLGARQAIRAFFDHHGWREGQGYLFAG